MVTGLCKKENTVTMEIETILKSVSMTVQKKLQAIIATQIQSQNTLSVSRHVETASSLRMKTVRMATS